MLLVRGKADAAVPGRRRRAGGAGAGRPAKVHSAEVHAASAAVGNLAVERWIARSRNPAPRAADTPGDAVADMPNSFPHADQIHRLLGFSLPLRSVVDPQACAARNTPAFTDGALTYFRSPAPDLHVAAHEAAHQLQHAGLTRDGGLGPEGHAAAVANAIATGRSARNLIGPAGNAVPAAERGYVESAATDWGRLGEMGQTLTFSSHTAFAAPALIGQANANLRTRRSGISLSAGGGSRTVEAPDGSGPKTLSQVAVAMESDPTGQKFYADCRQAAQEVMGGKGLPDAAIARPGGDPATIRAPEKVADFVALVFYIDQRIREHPDYPSLGETEKREFLKEVRSDYDWLSKEKREELRKRSLSAEQARQMSIDQHVAPEVGEAFAIFPADRPGIGGFKFHFATVIMAAGPDRVTLENSGGAPDQKSETWKIETYGPASKGQTFHDAWKMFGEHRHTLRIGNQPTPPDNGMDIRSTPTSTLLVQYARSADPNGRYYLKQELDQRSAFVMVEVQEREDLDDEDEVYATFSIGWGSVTTPAVAIPEGGSNFLTMPIRWLLPVTGSLIVRICESDLASPDDLIGVIEWPAPYAPMMSVPVSDGSARYVVTLSM